MKTSLIALTITIALPCIGATSDWKPSFNDKPVPPEDAVKIEKALPDKPIVAVDEPRQVLVYSATAGFRHRSIPYGKMALEKMGASSGAFEATVSDDPDNFEPGAIDQWDAIILLNPTQDFFLPHNKELAKMPEEEQKALRERQKRLTDSLINYVKNGGGVMGIHAATDSCYGHEEYGEMIGGYFWGHPWRANNNVTIVVEDPDHATIKPVFGGIDDFQLTEEIYQFKPEPYSREKLRILLHLDPERSDEVKGMRRQDNDYPVAWVQKVGEGRVFYSSIGHNNHIYWDPLMLKHYLAGIQFATGDLPGDTTPSAKK